MNFDDSINLINETTQILESDAFAFLTTLHTTIHKYKADLEKSLLQDANASISGAGYVKNITNHINSAISTASAFETSRLILQIEAKLDTQIEQIPENLATQIRAYIAGIVKFIRAIETYKFGGTNNVQEMYELILNISTSKSNLQSYRAGIELLKTYISEKAEIVEGQSVIDLAFYANEHSFQAFTSLAVMVDAVYAEICQILRLPSKSNALQVRMIYSGSVHFSLIGESKTLSMLEEILKNAGSYFYENYTRSGEFKKLTGNLAELIEKLQLLSSLTAHGIEVTEAKEQLEKSLTIIAKAISENLRHQYKININSAEVLIAPPGTKALPRYEPKLIPYRSLDELA